MANTLAAVLLKLAECLKGLRYSASTAAGSVTTLVDANMQEPNDFFNGGTIFFLSGTLAGKTAIISDFDTATNTFTFAAQTGAPGSGASYAAMHKNYTREALTAAINAALSELGPFPVISTDITFLTVAEQEEYTLPDGVYNVKKVFIASNAEEPYGWQENTGWFENAGLLIFDMEVPATADRIIRLYHEVPHARVSLDADEINNVIHPDLLAWTAAVRAVVVRMGFGENTEPNTKEIFPFVQQKAAMMAKHTIPHFRKASRPSGY